MRSRRQAGWLNAAVAVVIGVLVLFAAGGIFVALASLREGDADAPAGEVYLSLGDSVAAGNGASDPASTGYTALVASAHGGVSLFNVAFAGATTRDVLDRQMSRALGPTGAGRVRFISISAGGNDLASLIPNASCVEEPLPPACPLDEALADVERNLDTVVSMLRDANKRVPIVLLAYPNFFSATGHAWEAPAGRVLPRLNAVIESVAARYDRVAVARPAPRFEGRGDELTHVLDVPFDPHPNDEGHRIIAEAVLETLAEIEGG